MQQSPANSFPEDRYHMDNPRKYNESEIEAIFSSAARAQETARTSIGESEGLTLEELQRIGREAGITPEFIRRAAAALEMGTPDESTDRLVGLPIGVGRSAVVPGPLTDEAWDQLVADLRRTFRATGRTRVDGSLRQWRNGNLRASVEPVADGYRLDISTMNGNLRSGIVGGMVAVVLGLLLTVMHFLSGETMSDTYRTLVVTAMAVIGLATIAGFRLPGWARERKLQMKDVLERAMERSTAASVPRMVASERQEDELAVRADDAAESLRIDLEENEPEREPPAAARRIRDARD